MGATGSGLDFLRLAGSMVIVLLLLGALYWTLRKLKSVQRTQGDARALQLLETISLGPRQKVALLRVGDHQVLVGISPSQFTALGTWPHAANASTESEHAV